MKTRDIALMGLFIGLSMVGAYIKIPAITGTPALDSAPAFIAAALLSPYLAAIVGALGHIATAMSVGFPLSIGIHLLIAIEMGIIVWIYSYMYKKQKYLAFFVALILNGIVSPASFIPIFGMGFFVAMVIPLFIASFINLLIAFVVSEAITKRINKRI